VTVLSGTLRAQMTVSMDVDETWAILQNQVFATESECIWVRRNVQSRTAKLGEVTERSRAHTPIIVSENINDLPWFALYVKPRHEKNVTLLLERKGYQAFLPTYRHRAKYRKTFELPLFPGYVFCRIDVSAPLPVMTTPGVFSIVGNGPEPEAISEEEVQAVRRLIASGSTPVPWPYVMAGQEVSVESGPLQGVQGVVVDASNEKWLVVSVDLLRRSIAVKLERDCLRVQVLSPSTRQSMVPQFSTTN
jgi:transcription termination/antitermination protein NusG